MEHDKLPPQIRTFIAVRIPPVVLEQLASVQQQLKNEFRDVSWSRPEAMHLTLQFLGNILSNEVPRLEAVLTAAVQAHTSFELELSTLGSFNNRVLWVGVGKGGDELTALAESVRAVAKPFGRHEEDRAFNAHVTLGRFRERGRGVEAVLRRVTPPRFRPWRVAHVELIRSELSPKGSRYTTLHVASLKTTNASGGID